MATDITAGPLAFFAGILIFCFLASECQALDIKSCRGALGMETGEIDDASITASSYYVTNVGPNSARLNKDREGGGWCPMAQVEKGVREFIEIDLRGPHLVTGVATQGRYGGGRGQEFAEEYTLEYWRANLNQWHQYIRWDGKKVFGANSDTTTIVQHSLSPPVHANKIRIVPHSIHRRTVCLRLELYGCPDQSGIISYSAPVGSNEKGDHVDRMYDGWNDEYGNLVNGLGRLLDGQVGGDFFSLDMGYAKGSGWVAWKNSSSNDGYMELVFEFDQLRNISQIDLFTNNYFSRNVQIFSTAVVFFSIGGKFYNGDPVVHLQHPDKKLETARNVTIVFKGGRVARFIRVRLYFASEWIMLSEVYIQSEIMYMNLTEETEQRPFDDLLDNTILGNDWERRQAGSRPEVLIGVLTALILLLVVVFILILLVNKRNKYSAQSTTSLLRNTFTMKINMKDLFMNFTPNNNNAPSAITPTEQIQPGYVFRSQMVIESDQQPNSSDIETSSTKVTPSHQRKHSFVTNMSPAALNSKTIVSLAPNACGFIPNIMPNILQADINLDELNHYEETIDDYNHMFSTQSRSSLSKEVFGPPIYTSRKNSTMGIPTKKHSKLDIHNSIYDGQGSDYKLKGHTRDRSGSDAKHSSRGPREARSFGLSDVNMTHKKAFGTTPREKAKFTPAAVVWNISPSMTLPFVAADSDIIPIPLYCLQLISTIGSCHSGEISIYETQNIKAIMPDAPDLVQVRTARLKKGDMCMEYLKELRFLASLNHHSICKVLGVVTTDMPPLMVLEYSAAGDLYQLLKSSGIMAREPIRFPLLIFISIQICSAMKYLESRSVVHKDLAARNCLMYPGNRVKVTDMAICSPLYRENYNILIGEKPVPVRWQSWESVLLDRYTCPGLVWSFGVTMWEILSLCKQVPYCNLSLEDLLQNAEQQFYGSELKEILPKPNNCPVDLYRLMAECWKRDDSKRPTFEEIYHFMASKYKQHVPIDYPL